MNQFVVTMPQLGESVGEGVISRWLVRLGDYVAEFDALLEITTDKVDAEVPAPVSGVVVEFLVQEGATVPVGASIAVIQISAVPNDSPDLEVQPELELEVKSSETKRSNQPISASESATSPPATLPVSHDMRVSDDTRSDSHQARLDGDRLVPLSATRRAIAERMTLSKTTIPHAWQAQEVDMSGVVASITAHRASTRSQYGASLTYLPYVLAATAASLQRCPDVNASFDGDHIVIHREINLGVAVGLPDSVIVPVIRTADDLSVVGLALAARDLVTRAREKRLSVGDVAGATFTVNNSGTLGTLLSYAVIPPGQSGILTMGAVVDRPIAVAGKVDVRPMMYLCFSLDHRVMDGRLAAEFLGSCRQWLEDVSADAPVV